MDCDQIQSESTIEKEYFAKVLEDITEYRSKGLMYIEAFVSFEDLERLRDAVTGSLLALEQARKTLNIDYGLWIHSGSTRDLRGAIEVFKGLPDSLKKHVYGVSSYVDVMNKSLSQVVLSNNPDIRFLAINDGDDIKTKPYDNLKTMSLSGIFNMQEYDGMGVKARFVNCSKSINRSNAPDKLKEALHRILEYKRIHFSNEFGE